jgi:hypothetical protein
MYGSKVRRLLQRPCYTDVKNARNVLLSVSIIWYNIQYIEVKYYNNILHIIIYYYYGEETLPIDDDDDDAAFRRIPYQATSRRHHDIFDGTSDELTVSSFYYAECLFRFNFNNNNNIITK